MEFEFTPARSNLPLLLRKQEEQVAPGCTKLHRVGVSIRSGIVENPHSCALPGLQGNIADLLGLVDSRDVISSEWVIAFKFVHRLRLLASYCLRSISR